MRRRLAAFVVALAMVASTPATRAQGLISEPFYTLPGADADSLIAHAFATAPANQAVSAPTALLDQAQKIVTDHFYNPAGLKTFLEKLQADRETVQSMAEAGTTISQALRSLRASHTGRYTPNQIEYY